MLERRKILIFLRIVRKIKRWTKEYKYFIFSACTFANLAIAFIAWCTRTDVFMVIQCITLGLGITVMASILTWIHRVRPQVTYAGKRKNIHQWIWISAIQFQKSYHNSRTSNYGMQSNQKLLETLSRTGIICGKCQHFSSRTLQKTGREGREKRDPPGVSFHIPKGVDQCITDSLQGPVNVQVSGRIWGAWN